VAYFFWGHHVNKGTAFIHCACSVCREPDGTEPAIYYATRRAALYYDEPTDNGSRRIILVGVEAEYLHARRTQERGNRNISRADAHPHAQAKKTDDEYAYQHMLISSMQFLEGDENLLWGPHAYASQLNWTNVTVAPALYVVNFI